MRIVVRIDRVVLDGLPVERRDRGALEMALRTELTARLLAADGPPSEVGRRVHRLVGEPIRMSDRTGVAGLGSAIGGSVQGAIARGGRA